jgi:hypothetical protein
LCLPNARHGKQAVSWELDIGLAHVLTAEKQKDGHVCSLFAGKKNARAHMFVLVC